MNGHHDEFSECRKARLMKQAMEIAAGIREYPLPLKRGLSAHIEVAPGHGEADSTVVFVFCHQEDMLPSATEIKRAYRLTAREAEVALLMAIGHSDKRIALELNVSTCCASRHAEKVRSKMGIYSRRQVRGMLIEISRLAAK